MFYESLMEKTRAKRIEASLQGLQPELLEIVDDSARHAGHAGVQGVTGGETHYRIKIRSHAFAGKNRLQRHRMVQDLLQSEFDSGMHAVSITAELPE